MWCSQVSLFDLLLRVWVHCTKANETGRCLYLLTDEERATQILMDFRTLRLVKGHRTVPLHYFEYASLLIGNSKIE